MGELSNFLSACALSGETIELAYAGGSTPGRVRAVVIVSCDGQCFRAREEDKPTRIPKLFKISRVIWAQNKEKKIFGVAKEPENTETFPRLGSLGEYVELFRPELESAGWFLRWSPDVPSLGICSYFKNGKPQKTPKVSIDYVDRSFDVIFDGDDLVKVERKPTGRERPWCVGGRSFRHLWRAMEAFMEEARADKP